MKKLVIPMILCAILIPQSALAVPLVRCDLIPDRGVLSAGQFEKAVVQISLNVGHVPPPADRPPVNLALVLDRSGSMNGSKIEKAKEAAIEALHRLAPGDLFSLVVYDHTVQTLVPAQSAANTEWIEARIRSIRPGGNTALFGAVSQGAAEVRRNLHGEYFHRVILLSDGLANVGPSSPSDLARLGVALLKEGISVTTVGVGTDFNEDLMTQLAERSDGNHYFVESSRDLPRIFAAELGDVLSVAARSIRIDIELQEGVRPLRLIGRDGKIRGNHVELYLNQLYGGQEKYALLEIEVDPTEAGRIRDLARARCRYENALSNRPETSESLAQVRFSASRGDIVKSADKKVQEALVENEMAVAREKAVDLVNTGRKDEAVRQLREESAKLKARSASLGFSDLATEADSLDADAEEIAEEGLSAPRKKELKSESYRIRTQQKSY
ncbi:MAG: hypothetical protein C0616_00530 [Desulfuromonas sp.]|nr:MAG: hypothetical protein C0616_00530 [Desulfuromonas sp.]